MFDNAKAALQYLTEHEVQFVDLLYVNLFGGLHHQTLPVSYVSERTFVEGVGVDGSSIPGLGRLESGDRSALPDPSSFFELSLGPHRTLAVFCDIVEADTKVPARSYPRVVARRAEEFLRASGVATRSMWGPELEYYLFDEVSLDNRPEASGYVIRSAEAGWGEPDGGPIIRHQRGYHASPPADRLFEVRNETVLRLEAAGIPVALHHHEVGSAGQVEIEIFFADLPTSADNIVKAKLIARLVAAEFGYRATFMPKPLYGYAGSGLHFHQHLFKGDEPVFFQEGNYADLSATALAYTAGLLDHGGAVLALTNPSTNSYRRLVPGFEAPVKAFFSLANRSAAVRVPRYARTPAAKRIEFRPPDATCNPYLAMAAMLMAGLDGVRRGLDPTAEGFGPLDVNAEHLPTDERARIRSLPSSLGSALDALERDHAFLLEGGVFTPDLVSTWIAAGREVVQDLDRRPHPYEFALYLDV